MGIPDKIYLGIQDLGSGYTYDLSLDNNGEQEYIRKDALLEWIQKARAIPHDNGITRDLAFQEIVNKLNSM
jgi:hypothetical protein